MKYILKKTLIILSIIIKIKNLPMIQRSVGIYLRMLRPEPNQRRRPKVKYLLKFNYIVYNF